MRIIAGKHKGLVLNEFDVDNIRPTIDRVRESIFNKIQFEVAGSYVLDLFCGTGAVSLEFLSRGASRVVSIDNNRDSISITNKNFKKAKEKGEIFLKDFLLAINDLSGSKFDFIFLDPPYNTNYGEVAIERILTRNLLQEDGLIIYEHLIGKQFNLPKELEIVDERKFGTVVVTYIKRRVYD